MPTFPRIEQTRHSAAAAGISRGLADSTRTGGNGPHSCNTWLCVQHLSHDESGQSNALLGGRPSPPPRRRSDTTAGFGKHSAATRHRQAAGSHASGTPPALRDTAADRRAEPADPRVTPRHKPYHTRYCSLHSSPLNSTVPSSHSLAASHPTVSRHVRRHYQH